MSEPVQNTDRELWRESEGDFYSPSIHVTAAGGIGIHVGGMVYIKSVRNWHALPRIIAEQDAQIAALQERVHLCAGYDELQAENEALRHALDNLRVQAMDHVAPYMVAIPRVEFDSIYATIAKEGE